MTRLLAVLTASLVGGMVAAAAPVAPRGQLPPPARSASRRPPTSPRTGRSAATTPRSAIPSSGPASAYPAPIQVSGLTGTITGVDVRLNSSTSRSRATSPANGWTETGRPRAASSGALRTPCRPGRPRRARPRRPSRRRPSGWTAPTPRPPRRRRSGLPLRASSVVLLTAGLDAGHRAQLLLRQEERPRRARRAARRRRTGTPGRSSRRTRSRNGRASRGSRWVRNDVSSSAPARQPAAARDRLDDRRVGRVGQHLGSLQRGLERRRRRAAPGTPPRSCRRRWRTAPTGTPRCRACRPSAGRTSPTRSRRPCPAAARRSARRAPAAACCRPSPSAEDRRDEHRHARAGCRRRPG